MNLDAENWWEEAQFGRWIGESPENCAALCVKLAWWNDYDEKTKHWGRRTLSINSLRADLKWAAFFYEARTRAVAEKTKAYLWPDHKPFYALDCPDKYEGLSSLNPISSTILTIHDEGECAPRGLGWTPPIEINLCRSKGEIRDAVWQIVEEERSRQGITQKSSGKKSSLTKLGLSGLPWDGLECWDRKIVMDETKILSEVEAKRVAAAKKTLRDFEARASRFSASESKRAAEERWESLTSDERDIETAKWFESLPEDEGFGEPIDF